jgi:CBS domain-containing protein
MTITVAELLQDKARQSPAGILFSVPPDAPVSVAVTMMVSNKISSVIVKNNDAMVGLITLRELLKGLHTHGDTLLKKLC